MIIDQNNIEYSLYIEEHFNSISYYPLPIMIISGIMIVTIFTFFIIFMGINSTKTLYINNGFPLY